MKNYTIIRDKPQKMQSEDNPCQTAMQTGVLEVKVAGIEKTLEEHKKNTEKNFSALEKRFEKSVEDLKDHINEKIDEIKAISEKQEEKLEKVEEKVDNIKNSLTALIAKFGIVFSFLASIGMFSLNYLVEKLKG